MINIFSKFYAKVAIVCVIGFLAIVWTSNSIAEELPFDQYIPVLPKPILDSDPREKCVGPLREDGTQYSTNHIDQHNAVKSCSEEALRHWREEVLKAIAEGAQPGDVVSVPRYYMQRGDFYIEVSEPIPNLQELFPSVPPQPVPVDCSGNWSNWSRIQGSESECVNAQRTFKESRKFTVLTPPENGGLACPESPESRVSSEECSDGGTGGNYIPLTISENGRYFMRGGEPFFWIGDTAWKATHTLTNEQITAYLQDVASRGFNVVQGPIFMSGEVLPPWGNGPNDPISSLNPTTFKSPRINRIDHFVRTASDLGLVVAVPLVWGPHSNRFFEKDATRAAEYTTAIVSRFKDYPNVVIIVSGEFNKVKWVATTDPWSGEWDKSAGNDPLTTQEKAMFNAMGNAARAAAHPESLITIHPDGWKTPGDEFHDEPWYDFPMLQSYTSLLNNFENIRKERSRAGYKPVVQAENFYESAPGASNEITPWMVRQSFYHCYFMGCAGHTYGARDLWDFAPNYETALDREGRVQISTHFRAFVEDTFSLDLVPDQSLLVNGSGWPPNNNAVFVLRTPDSSKVMIYTSKGTTPRVNTSLMADGTLSGRWFNPRSGAYNATFNVNRGTGVWLSAPSQGDNNDWVLVIDSDGQPVVAAPENTTKSGVLSLRWTPSNLNEDGTPSAPEEQGFTLYYGTEPRKSVRGSATDYPSKLEVQRGKRSIEVPVAPGVYYVAMTANHPAAAIPEDPKGEGFFSDEVRVVVE